MINTEMRTEFEKLPEITNSLSEHIWFGDDNLYHSSLINFQGLVNWLNGAWYAFQEQQKRIDALEAYKEQLLDDLNNITHTLD